MNTHGATVNRGEIVSMYAGLLASIIDATKTAHFSITLLQMIVA